jgi:hypothetical protein
MKPSINLILSSVAVCLYASSCAPNIFKEHYVKSTGASGDLVKTLGISKTPSSDVKVYNVPQPNNYIDYHNKLRKSGMVYLGHSQFWTESYYPHRDKLLQAASSLGADTVYVYQYDAGRGQKRVLVPLYHTTGQMVTSTTDYYGSYRGSSYLSDSGSYIDHSGNYDGQSSSSTYISGSTTYGYEKQTFKKCGVQALYYVHKSKLSEKGQLIVEASRSKRG